MRNGITKPTLLLLLVEVIALALLAVGVSSHFGLADGIRITVAFFTAYLVPRIILTRARGTSTAAIFILLIIAVALMYIDYLRLVEWTRFDGYSLTEPNIQGDGRLYYKWALNKFDGRVGPQNVIFPGYPMIILSLWNLFGLNVVWPQALNLMGTLTAIVLMGMTTRRLLTHRVTTSPQILIAGSILFTGVLNYFLFIGTMVLKEGVIILAIMMAGYALSSMAATDEERHHPVRDMVMMVLACILLALVRTTYLYFIALGIVVMALPRYRRDWPMALSMLVLVGLALLLGNSFSAYSFDRHAEIAGGGWNMQRFYVESESQQFYHDLLDYYFLRPFWYKAMMLPLTLSVQFIIPFPWTYYDTPTFTIVFARFSYGWYLVGGMALFYFLVMAWRRDGNSSMGAWPWWAAFSFAVIAWVMAGSVARYVTPVQPLFVPVAVFVMCRLREGRFRKAFAIWSICFVIAIIVTLLFCLEIQQAAISKMLHTRSLVHYLKGIPY